MAINPNLLALLQPNRRLQRPAFSGGLDPMGLSRPVTMPAVTPQARPGMGPNYIAPNELSTMERLAQMFSGARNVDASNIGAVKDAGRMGLMQAGLALLAAPATKGSFGSNLANAIGTGMGAARGAYQESEFDAALESMDPGMRALVKAFGPGETARLMDVMRPQTRDRFRTVGNQIWDEATGEWITPPEMEDPWEPTGTLAAAYAAFNIPIGTEPGDLTPEQSDNIRDWLLEKERAGVPGTPDAARTALAELDVKRIEKDLEALDGATAQMQPYTQMLELLDEVPEGMLADVQTGVGQFFSSFGVNIPGTEEAEVFQALSNILAINKRNPAGGAGLPGQMSDKDVQFLLAMVPKLTNTREGNRLLLEYNIAVMDHLNALRAARVAHFEQYGSLRGWSDKEWAESQPSFTDRLRRPTQTLGPVGTPAGPRPFGD